MSLGYYVGDVEDAEAARERARYQAEKALTKWKSTQGAELRNFLVAEATITAKTQHEVTLRLGEEVQTFKARAIQAAEAAAKALDSWTASLTVDQILTMPGNLNEALQTEVLDAVAPWVELFRRAGFDAGSPSGRDYGGGHEHHPWQFYNPSTGTARSDRFPVGETLAKLNDAVGRYSDSIRAVAAAERSRDVQAAADLWGD